MREDNVTPELNEVKYELCEFFKQRQLCTLPHPGKEELTGATSNELSEVFQGTFNGLMATLGESLQQNAKPISITMIVPLLNKCVDIINKGEIIKLDSLWTSIVKSEEEAVFKKAINNSKNMLKQIEDLMPLNTRDVLKRLSTARNVTALEFVSHFNLDEAILKTRLKQIEEYYNEIDEKYVQINIDKSELHCNKLIEKASNEIHRITSSAMTMMNANVRKGNMERK